METDSERSLRKEDGDNVFALQSHTCSSHLLDHVSDFPLLAFQHVIQMVDLFFEYGHLLLQLLSPKNTHSMLQHAIEHAIDR